MTDDAESDELPASKPGFEVIDLDLSKVPSVEEGIAAARERYKTFIAIAKEAMGDAGDEVLLTNHLPFMAFINRACSLHRGVILAVQDENPHSAFTLLRAYLELVVTVHYIDSHPVYLRDLERPIDQGGKRKRFKEIFEFAARELRGVRTAYSHLSEMGHFGSTAMWMAFSVGDDDDEDSRRLSFGTGPHWKKPEDPKIALAMLLEDDEAMFEVLGRFALHHIQPAMEHHREGERMKSAFATLGAEASDLPNAIGFTPWPVMLAAMKARLVVWCEDDKRPELAEGVNAEQVEAFVANYRANTDAADPAGETPDL